MVILGGCSTDTAHHKSPVRSKVPKKDVQHTEQRPDFHVSQYHILPGCLICSDAEFPLETLNSREASQLCRSANHSCFSNQMLETASSKLLPGAALPVVSCTASSSSALLPTPSDLKARPPHAPQCHPTSLVLITSQDR